MPVPVPPGHPGLHVKDRAPDRRTMDAKQGCSTAGAAAVSGATCAAWPRLHRTFRHGAAGGAQGQIAHLLPGSKQNLQKEGDRPVETAPREGMRHVPKRPGATGEHWRRIPAESLPAGFRRMQGEPGTTLLSPARLQKRKEGPLSESLHLSDQSGMRITSWIYAHRAVRRAGPCCGSRYGRCRTGA